MTEKLKVKFLTCIWGERYIEEFARLSLPSYLADGNLPFVAAETDLEIVIMTSTESRDVCEKDPVFRKLGELCPIRYIFIDDLIAKGNYGVTLTLAYARGIMSTGAEQTETTFVFMNSDFVLADGSLRTMVERLKQGHRCIMAPSLRACSESVGPILLKRVDQRAHRLTMPPREMVQLAFDHLHHTVVAKTVTQNFVTSKSHNQIYWQVDETTMLARYYLIFMLAIRPEVPMGPVNSYCDYGFVPELVPSHDFLILDDSDDFFMLELQSRTQERDFLSCGMKPIESIANELSIWTTKEHRDFAAADVVFHSGEVPERIGDARKAAAQFVAKVANQLSASPKSHVDHFYWVLGLQSWGILKFAGAPVRFPPEVAAPPQSQAKLGDIQRTLKHPGTTLVGFMRRRRGVMPVVPVWHHLWQDAQLIRGWANNVSSRPAERNLLICDEDSPLSATLPRLMAIDVCPTLRTLTRPGKKTRASAATQTLLTLEPTHPRYDNVLLHIYRQDVRKVNDAIAQIRELVVPGGTIAIFVDHPNAETDPSNFRYELAQHLDVVLPENWIRYKLKAQFTGGRPKRFLRRAEIFLFDRIGPGRSLVVNVAAASAWLGVASLTILNNLCLGRNKDACPPYCSSALLVMEPDQQRIAAAPTDQKEPGKSESKLKHAAAARYAPAPATSSRAGAFSREQG
jgi:hypothetical protein